VFTDNATCIADPLPGGNRVLRLILRQNGCRLHDQTDGINDHPIGWGETLFSPRPKLHGSVPRWRVADDTLSVGKPMQQGQRPALLVDSSANQ